MANVNQFRTNLASFRRKNSDLLPFLRLSTSDKCHSVKYTFITPRRKAYLPPNLTPQTHPVASYAFPEAPQAHAQTVTPDR